MSESTKSNRNSRYHAKRDVDLDSSDEKSYRHSRDSRRGASRERRPESRRDGRTESDEDVDLPRNQASAGLDQNSRRDRAGDSSKRDRKYRHRSNSRDRSHYQQRSRSPPAKRSKRSEDRSRSPTGPRRQRGPLPSQDESFRGGMDITTSDGPPVDKQKPNYKPTGLLAKEANTVAGTTTVLKYHEPPEARKPPPKEQWRMYVFKQKDLLDTVYLHERSVWLMGRDQNVTDLLLEHPSISKQHAAVQFRYITTTNEFGDKSSRVKPYLIDLESANGTKLNGKKVEASRYVELVDGDVIAFGHSEREYVMMLPPVEKK